MIPLLASRSMGILSLMCRSASMRTMSSSSVLYPKAALMVIGDEVLKGSTVDTNTPWLANKLYGRGVDVRSLTYPLHPSGPQTPSYAAATHRASDQTTFAPHPTHAITELLRPDTLGRLATAAYQLVRVEVVRDNEDEIGESLGRLRCQHTHIHPNPTCPNPASLGFLHPHSRTLDRGTRDQRQWTMISMTDSAFSPCTLPPLPHPLLIWRLPIDMHGGLSAETFPPKNNGNEPRSTSPIVFH